MAALLPAIWTPAKLLPQQLAYLHSTAWMNVVVSGRRSFKTEAAKRRVVRAAMMHTEPGGRFFCTAPTQDQAREIFWEDQSNIRDLVPSFMLAGGARAAIRHSSPQTVFLANGARIIVAGLDRPARIEGGFWDGGVITEYGNCKANILAEHISPMLARGGWLDIEGVPEGRNHYYDLVCDVRAGKIPGARLFEWNSEDALPLYLDDAAGFLERERAHMSARQYDQEWLGMFVSMEGQAYYAFDPELNVSPPGQQVLHDPDLPLILCFDFNRVPGVCAYLQEHPLDRYPWIKNPNTDQKTVTAAVGEIFIRHDSNTRRVCQRIIEDWGHIHRVDVILYGDATGGAGGSAKVEGSDWDIIENMLRPVFKHFLRSGVPEANPAVRSRVNSVNTRLVAANGAVGMVIDQKNCPNLIRDFEGVEADDAGEIVKEQGSPLTHISDGVGYYLHRVFPAIAGLDASVKSGTRRRTFSTRDSGLIPGRRA